MNAFLNGSNRGQCVNACGNVITLNSNGEEDRRKNNRVFKILYVQEKNHYCTWVIGDLPALIDEYIYLMYAMQLFWHETDFSKLLRFTNNFIHLSFLK